jgi:hypothetical protein
MFGVKDFMAVSALSAKAFMLARIAAIGLDISSIALYIDGITNGDVYGMLSSSLWFFLWNPMFYELLCQVKPVQQAHMVHSIPKKPGVYPRLP